jgi:hypothetical protein
MNNDMNINLLIDRYANSSLQLHLSRDSVKDVNFNIGSIFIEIYESLNIEKFKQIIVNMLRIVQNLIWNAASNPDIF